MTTFTFTNTDRTAAQEMADRVNAAVAAGQQVQVAGRKVRAFHTEAAQVWNNGSVSIDVETRDGRRVNSCGVWAKVGSTVTVTVS
jgi:hypothetical protein